MIGQTISHYKILEKLGEGGMGVVYKAQDTKLNRAVALKFLPAHLSASEQDKARFLQEAQAAASLNHPNICTIYGIDEHDGQIFIAMELVEGETLREKKQSFSVKQTVDIGVQIAEGLAAAHEKGIVHRDIKPENIMIRKDGIVQIMDFGLAKLRGASRLTKEGTMVGTVGYMSPEQVQGHDTDHRTDIFSLGVILYELLSGQSPFKGVHETAIIYEIVNVDAAPISSLKPEVTTDLDSIVLECLAKEPDERYQSAKEVAKELRRFKRESSRTRLSRVSVSRPAYSNPSGEMKQTVDDSATVALPTRWSMFARRYGWMAIGLVLFCTTVALLYVLSTRSASTGAGVVRASLLPPEKHSFLGGSPFEPLAISPDGQKIAFLASDSMGRRSLWVRPINVLTATELSGTDGAQDPFWSPDNRYIAFFAGGKLKKVEATGGPPFSICDVVNPRGGSWSQQGVIVLPVDQTVALSQVSDAGGTPVLLTKLDTARKEYTHRWPFFLPDGKHFLYFARTSPAYGGSALDAIAAGSLDGKTDRRLVQGISNPAYANGYLLYMRENSLMAHQFDADALELKGDPFPITESIQFNPRFSVASFSVSQSGVLVYEARTISATPEMALVNPRGEKMISFGELELFIRARLSKDSRKVAMDLYDISSRNADIWLQEIQRGVRTRFTFDPAIDWQPVWSPDGAWVVFTSQRRGPGDLYKKSASGASNEELLYGSTLSKAATDWSSEGKFVLFNVAGDPKLKTDIWILPMTGEKKPTPFLQTEYNELNARFSPDMKWVAYQSDASGKNEIYVRPFPGPGAQWQVSASGGISPTWNRNGKEIFFLNGGKIMSAEVNGSGSTFEIGKVKLYFDPQTIGGIFVYDVSDDGQKILLGITKGQRLSEPLTLVLNWQAEARKK
jgi:serine/threonine protein kinase